jgi:hypothetical protein
MAKSSDAPVGAMPVEGAPVATAMGAALNAAGLDVANMPALDDLSQAQRKVVMKSFADALGVECSECHTSKFSDDTPNKRIARKMWSVFVQTLTLPGGQPLYCDSCHQGKATFLVRDDEDQLKKWMKAAFVDGLARRDAQTHSCKTCHGDPFVGGFLDDWGADDGMSPPAPDLAQAAPTDASAPTDGGVLAPACTPVINELQAAGAAGAADEFIELYNPCPTAVDLTGYALVYRSAAGTSDLLLVALGARSLAAGAYLVAANADFAGARDLAYTRGLAGTGGGVGLRDASDALVDAVGYGSASNAFVIGTAAPAPPSGQSIARTPNGSRGSGDQSHDWTVGAPTPGAANR